MKQSQPLVTVLMPCYNAMPHLPIALESIIHQTYKNLEILCINDGSSDDTPKVLEQYAKKDYRIKIINNETNIKLIKTLNKGIEIAQGEYIARMDADDISFPSRIEKELKYLQDNPEVDIVSCGVININNEGKLLSDKIIRQKNRIANFFASFFYVPIGHPELLIKTKVLKENNFLFEDHVLHTEDYELWSRLLRLGYDLRNIDIQLLYFRINPESVSRKYTDIQNENFVECARRHFNVYTGIKLPVNIAKILFNRIDTTAQKKDFIKAIKQFKLFSKHFIAKENIKKNNIKKEIKVVYYTHLFDICYQFFKNKNGLIKLLILWIIIINIKGFFNKKVLQYIKNKKKKITLDKYAHFQCQRCVMDTSDPDITFDQQGFCNHCSDYLNRLLSQTYQGKASNDKLANLLQNVRKKGKNKAYDCVIGVSGGVDSLYVLWLAKTQWNLRPLAVHMDNGWNSELAVDNIEKICKKLYVDLHTEVLDYQEFADLQLSFLKASVIEAETPTDIAIPAVLHKVAAQHGIKYIFSGGNYATEGILPKFWHYNAKDTKYLYGIHKKFGKIKLKTFPTFGYQKEIFYKFFKRIRMAYPLNKVPYDKKEAVRVLEQELGWRNYGGKHHESIYTKWVQGYYLFIKFGIDYRKATYSSQICTGAFAREHALEDLKKLPYNPVTLEADIEYLCKKLYITREEYEQIMAKPPKTFKDYPNNERILSFIYKAYRKLQK